MMFLWVVSKSHCKDNTSMIRNVRFCPFMSVFVRIKVKKISIHLLLKSIIRIFVYLDYVVHNTSSIDGHRDMNRPLSRHQTSYIINHTSKMFTPRSYGKAELALLYQPSNTPNSAVKTLVRWINRCPMLVDELKSMNYNPRRHTFLKPEVEAIVRHLGTP